MVLVTKIFNKTKIFLTTIQTVIEKHCMLSTENVWQQKESANVFKWNVPCF